MKSTNLTTIARFACVAILMVTVARSARATTNYPTLLQTFHPVAYWRFTNNSPTIPLNIVTNHGSVGTIGNGFIVNGGSISNGQPGVGSIGTSIQFFDPEIEPGSDDFDGYPGDDDSKIEVPWNALFNPNPPFSIEFWTAPNNLVDPGVDPTGYSPLSSVDVTGGSTREGFLFYLDGDGGWHFYLGNASGYTCAKLNATNGNASTNVWQHIVGTFDGTNASIYIDGALSGETNALAANFLPNSEAPLRFGAGPLYYYLLGNFEAFDAAPYGSRSLDGWLQHVAIYTNILSPSTILAHYNGSTLSPAGYSSMILSNNPVGYWPLNEPQIDTNAFSVDPLVDNIGSLGTDAEGTNQWGSTQARRGPGYAGFGTLSNAFFFDGESGDVFINNTPGLVFPEDPDGNVGPGVSSVTNTISLVAWVKPTEDNYYRTIIEQGFDTNESEIFLRIGNGGGAPGVPGVHYYEVGMVQGDISDPYEDVVQAQVPAGDIGNWVFLVGTFDGTNWNLYRDGVAVGTPYSYDIDGDVLDYTPQGTGPTTVYEPWTIGSRANDFSLGPLYNIDIDSAPTWIGVGDFFGGWIAEPAILTNALQPSDVAALYAAAQVPPVITGNLVNPGNVDVGVTVDFSIQADGVPSLGYLWYTNGVSTGDTTTNYVFQAATLGTNTVSVVVTDPYGTTTPSVSFLVQNGPPILTSEPDPLEKRFTGFPFSFSITTVGTLPISYYWFQGSTLVQFGSSDTYSNIANSGTAGSYTVIASNAFGTVTSSPGVLVVNPVPGYFTGQVISNNLLTPGLAPTASGYHGPIAYWKLDETSGSVAYDQVGGNDGTYYNVTLGVPGYSLSDPDDKAVAFNGDDSYVGNISGTAINFAGTNNNSFSLEAWAKATPNQAQQATIIAKGIGNSGGTENEQFSLDVIGGVYRFFTVNPKGVIVEALATSGPDNLWDHVVGVYDSVYQTLSIYVNGVLSGQANYNQAYAGQINDTVSPVSIGSKRLGNSPDYAGTYDGSIDNVVVYNYALSQSQVLADFQSAYTNAPQIEVQPAPTTNFAGIPVVTLSVTAVGKAPLGYQWYKNGVAIPGATYAAITNSPLVFADAGNYYVVVSNSVGVTNSVTVPLVVYNPPTNPPVIPGLVLHMTFQSNLFDYTGRGNNGVGQYTTLNASLINTGASTASNGFYAVTVATNPVASNPSFYYIADGSLFPGTAGLHYSTLATKYSGGDDSGSGIGTNDYYVTLGNRSDLQFGTNDFTVSMWVRLPVQVWGSSEFDSGYFQGGDLPFFTDAIGSTGGPGFLFAPAYGYGTVDPEPPGNSEGINPINKGDWAVSAYEPGAGNYGSGLALAGVPGNAGEINDGLWHNLIYVISRSTDKLIVYRDGIAVPFNVYGGTDLNAAGNLNSTNYAAIGQDPTGFYGEECQADIADLGVWKRSLSSVEVGAIYVAAISNQLSFTAPVTLTLYPTNTTQFAISWPPAVTGSSNYLQAASNPLGAFTNVTGATSPYVFSPSGSQKYFRIAQTNVYVIP